MKRKLKKSAIFVLVLLGIYSVAGPFSSIILSKGGNKGVIIAVMSVIYMGEYISELI